MRAVSAHFDPPFANRARKAETEAQNDMNLATRAFLFALEVLSLRLPTNLDATLQPRFCPRAPRSSDPRTRRLYEAIVRAAADRTRAPIAEALEWVTVAFASLPWPLRFPFRAALGLFRFAWAILLPLRLALRLLWLLAFPARAIAHALLRLAWAIARGAAMAAVAAVARSVALACRCAVWACERLLQDKSMLAQSCWIAGVAALCGLLVR